MKEPYRDWAEGHIKRVRDILYASRAEHTQVVKDRIQSVEQMKDVVSVTEGLFALSKVRRPSPPSLSPFFPHTALFLSPLTLHDTHTRILPTTRPHLRFPHPLTPVRTPV